MLSRNLARQPYIWRTFTNHFLVLGWPQCYV